jgi:hypothetical protein
MKLYIVYRYRDDHEQADRDIRTWGPHQLIRLKNTKIMKVLP